jgi:hypothetical protein
MTYRANIDYEFMMCETLLDQIYSPIKGQLLLN